MKIETMVFLTFFTLIIVILVQNVYLTYAIDCKNVVSTQKTCPHPNITFWLYNKVTTRYQLDPTNNNTILKAPFLNNKTKFLLNGYNGSLNNYINEFVRPKYIDLGYNVISLDYYSLVPEPCYFEAVKNVDIISNCFKDFVKYIFNFKKNLIQDVHVVGFSLGAQIAGKTGKLLKNYNIRFSRLTGLDAAAPSFYGLHSEIDSTSAKFVDTIHTNSLIYGKLLPIGHIDFYVNAIFFQTPCIGSDEGNLILCSHTMACKYFGASIKNETIFCGQSLNLFKSKQRMGEYVSLSARGVYWVNINSFISESC